VAEIITVTDTNIKNIGKTQINAGPNHAASALTLWAIVWCLLLSLLIFYSPLESVVAGGCFQKDAYTST